MATIVYPCFRATSRPLEFGGFKGQYILFAAAALVIDLLLFVILYCCHAAPWFCVLFAFGLGAAALWTTQWMSRRFGTDGLMKYFATKRLPRLIRFDTRQVYLSLQKHNP